MTYIILLLAVLFGFTRGVKEGMVMIQTCDWNSRGKYYANPEDANGVRSHQWFKYYHHISVLAFCFFALGYGMLLRMPFDWALISLILFILWETTEIGYSIARFSRVLPDSEDILFIRLRFHHVLLMHIFRFFVIAIYFRAILMKG